MPSNRCILHWPPSASRTAASLLLWACIATPSLAQQPAPAAPSADAPGLSADAAIRASQQVLGQRIGEHTLLERDGRPVRLADFRGKPLLVSFIYTGCFQVCPANTRALQQAVERLQTRFGTRQFNVASIGFNQPADSPLAMKAFAQQHGISFPHWAFLSPAAADVDALTREFGFSYQATPAGFDHVLQVTLVDADGRIVRQVYGGEVPADALGEPLKQLLLGAPVSAPSSLASLVDRVRILCTVYDPKTGTYRVDYSLAIEVAGGLTFLVSVLLYFLNEWRGRRLARRALRA